MTSLRKIATVLICAAIVCGAGILWQVQKENAIQKNLAEDAKAYRERAERGDPRSQYDLGNSYAYGWGVPKNDYEAVLWYRRAAEQGYARGEYALSFMYYKGKGVPRDYSEAIQWVRKAAVQGYAKAQHALGHSYAEGQGVPRDLTEAAGWYLKAAGQGDANAQYDLGLVYRKGQGVPYDDAEAVRWLTKAAGQGNEQAKLALEAISGRSKGSLVAFVVRREMFSPRGLAALVSILFGVLVLAAPERWWRRAPWMPSALVSVGAAGAVVRMLLPPFYPSARTGSLERVIWMVGFGATSAVFAIAAVVEAARGSKGGRAQSRPPNTPDGTSPSPV